MVTRGVIGESTLITPVGVHHVDFSSGKTVSYVSIPIRREGNPCLRINDCHQKR